VTPAPRYWYRARLLAGEEALEADWLVPGGQLQHAVEQQAAASRAAPVEAEDELIQVGGQMRLIHRSLVGT